MWIGCGWGGSAACGRASRRASNSHQASGRGTPGGAPPATVVGDEPVPRRPRLRGRDLRPGQGAVVLAAPLVRARVRADPPLHAPRAPAQLGERPGRRRAPPSHGARDRARPRLGRDRLLDLPESRGGRPGRDRLRRRRGARPRRVRARLPPRRRLLAGRGPQVGGGDGARRGAPVADARRDGAVRHPQRAVRRPQPADRLHAARPECGVGPGVVPQGQAVRRHRRRLRTVRRARRRREARAPEVAVGTRLLRRGQGAPGDRALRALPRPRVRNRVVSTLGGFHHGGRAEGSHASR